MADFRDIVIEWLDKHKDNLKGGYLAVHDRAGNVLEKCELNEHLYDVSVDYHGPLPGEVIPGHPDEDADLYDNTANAVKKPGKIKKPKKVPDADLPSQEPDE